MCWALAAECSADNTAKKEPDKTRVKPIPVYAGLALFAVVLILPAPADMSPEAWRLLAVAATSPSRR